MKAVTSGDVLRYRLRAFQENVRRTEAIIAEALGVMTRPAVAFSGGKDSLVALALVARQRPDALVFWSDEELIHDETPGYVRQAAATLGVDLTVVGEINDHGGWFYSWSLPPFWRDPLPEMTLTGTRNLREWLRDRGVDGTFIGLRKAEAARRRTFLSVRGALTRTAFGWQCNPLAGWTTDEVWAFIAGRDLPYNPVYDRLAQIGIPRAMQRVGPLTNSPAWILRDGWPDLYRRLVDRYGPRWE